MEQGLSIFDPNAGDVQDELEKVDAWKSANFTLVEEIDNSVTE